MKIFITISTVIIIVVLASSCQKEENVTRRLRIDLIKLLEVNSPTNRIDYYAMPHEEDYPNIPQDPKNPLSAEKVALGQLLFHETGLALNPKNEIGKDTYSCASCHFAGAGFQAGRHQGIADGGSGFGLNGEGRTPMLSLYTGDELDCQPIRTPSAMNGAYQVLQLWNGQFGSTGDNAGTQSLWLLNTPLKVNHLGYEGLESQAIAGLEVHRMLVNKAIIDSLGYKEIFDAVFWAKPEDERYTMETAGLAIAAYERTLLSNQAPFQKFVAGNHLAMNVDELKGAVVFFGKGNCGSCHSGPALNSMEFYALGTNDLNQIDEETFRVSEHDRTHLGRGHFTGKMEDMYKVKVPQLYNLIDSPYYFHGSSKRTLGGVVQYKNEAIPEKLAVPKSQLAKDFVPLGLSDEEMENLTSFLETALYDPNLQRYAPTETLSGNCFPYNDEVSRIDLGCD